MKRNMLFILMLLALALTIQADQFGAAGGGPGNRGNIQVGDEPGRVPNMIYPEYQDGSPNKNLALTITPNDNASQLIAAFKDPTDACLTITSVSFSGDPMAAGLYTDGVLGMADGMILASGNVTNALPPNTSSSISTNFGLPGCAECDAIIPGYTSYDAAIFEIVFDVNPACSSVAFNFIFGSDEYPEYVNSSFNDVFGAYLNGVQVAYDEDGHAISINGGYFSGPYVQVPPANGLEYDGCTYMLQTSAPVVPGSEGNVLRFVVCDAGDHIYDAGVFLARFRGGGAPDTCTGIAPQIVFSEDIDCGDTLYAELGNPISFDVTAFDNGPNQDIVELTLVGSLPPGATLTPGLPQTGNPVVSTFDWIPDTDGVFQVDFMACDQMEEQCQFCTPCRVYISVGAPPTGIVYGYVTSTADGQGLAGVPILVTDEFSALAGDDWTDPAGYYAIEVPSNDYYTVGLGHMPLGYLPASQTSVDISVPGGDSVRVDFLLEEHCLDCEVYTLGFWHWQVYGALCNYGGMQYDAEELMCIIGKVNQHFGPHFSFWELNTLQDLYAILNGCDSDNCEYASARAYFMAVLMNTVTGRMNTYDIVSEDGATASQAIQQIVIHFTSFVPDYEAACYLAKWLTWEWYLVPAGHIDLGLPQVAYKSAGATPNEFGLAQNRPNPFNPVTEIAFTLPASGDVVLTVYNTLGQIVSTQSLNRLGAGEHVVLWDGSGHASGVYFYRIQSDEFVDTKKMVLMK